MALLLAFFTEHLWLVLPSPAINSVISGCEFVLSSYLRDLPVQSNCSQRYENWKEEMINASPEALRNVHDGFSSLNEEDARKDPLQQMSLSKVSSHHTQSNAFRDRAVQTGVSLHSIPSWGCVGPRTSPGGVLERQVGYASPPTPSPTSHGQSG